MTGITKRKNWNASSPHIGSKEPYKADIAMGELVIYRDDKIGALGF